MAGSAPYQVWMLCTAYRQTLTTVRTVRQMCVKSTEAGQADNSLGGDDDYGCSKLSPLSWCLGQQMFMREFPWN